LNTGLRPPQGDEEPVTPATPASFEHPRRPPWRVGEQV
jgi:hypothetical protein